VYAAINKHTTKETRSNATYIIWPWPNNYYYGTVTDPCEHA